MALVQFRDDEGIWCPIVVCDYCGRRITEASNGNYEYQPRDDGEPSPMRFSHKQCSEPLRERYPGMWYCDELSKLPMQLAWNLGQHDAALGIATHEDLIRAGRNGDRIDKELRAIRVLPPLIRKLVFDRDKVCQECGSDERLTIDHRYPVAKGGGNNIENLRVLCHACNLEKRDTV